MDESKTAGKTEAEIMKEINRGLEETRTNLLVHLLSKVEQRIATNSWEFLQQELQDKVDAPGGPALLDCVGYVYISEAKKNMGRLFGVEGFMAGMEQKGHNVKQTFSVASSVIKLAQAQAEIERKGEMGQEIDAEVQAQMMNHGLDAMWKLGKMEIEKTCRTVCSMLLSSDKKQRKKRAGVLKELGDLYRDRAKQARRDQGHAGTFKDFVQNAERAGASTETA